MTTIRSGPMDEDTRNFGLEFGANEFTMTGKNLVARIENVSAKHIKYDVTTGTVTSFPCTCRCSSECFTRIDFRIKFFFSEQSLQTSCRVASGDRRHLHSLRNLSLCRRRHHCYHR